MARSTPHPRILPPLVEPGDELTPEQVTRFSRHIVIPDFGQEAQRRLLAAKVAVIGAGGLGSPILLYLAAAGVGTVGIIDDDSVESSNLQRQVIHGTQDIGRPKGESARDSILERNPDATVRLHPVRLTSKNAIKILGDYDLVIDGSDNFSTRYLASDAAEILGIPCVWGSILRYSGQASTFWAAPNDGLPGVTYRDLFAQPPAPGTVPSCAEGGVLGVLCSMIGTIMATDTIKLITGIGSTLLGRIVNYDAQLMSWREITIGPDPERTPVTQLDDYDALCGITPRAQNHSSREHTDSEGFPETHESVEWSSSFLAAALTERASGTRKFRLIDIRESHERELAVIQNSEHIPLNDLLHQLHNTTSLQHALHPDEEIVLYCHHGSRSDYARQMLNAAGYTRVRHLQGGIDRWSLDVDPSIPRY
ncbi:ThiF family adenylyltransferase [Lysinibacter sp. HNR]|uniref:ThiF family adenylyltransferase n=1 Tax=Lysinibacter sp. HNR TaxID=3031408 RepID=UPI0024351009|nr:ThiF family adenylyltransferase [Lysinibacter sp. HNR]WGD36450.1 ThiF family adenylyltransferase [Lysinibacter sp. HNR]